MSKAAKSILAFGIYVALLGLGLLLDPNTSLTMFGFPPTEEPWIRLAGILLLILSYYYIQAARNEVTIFFQWTVHARPCVVVIFSAMVALGLAKPILILSGCIDLLGAIWTGLALRQTQVS